MKIIYVSLLLTVYGSSLAQNEFPVFSNGLIYDEPTMKRLGAIVDSVNVRFKACDLAHPYYSMAQGWATVVTVPGKDARKLIENGISLDEFKSRYPHNIRHNAFYVVKARYRNRSGKKFIEYSGLPHGWSSEESLTVSDKLSNDKSSGWVLNDDYKTAMYLDKLERVELPYSYARLVQYVDCMIDTTALIHLPDAEGRIHPQVSPGTKADMFIKWVDSYPGQPQLPEYEEMEKQNLDWDSVYTAHTLLYRGWDSARIAYLDEQMHRSEYRKNMLIEATDEALANGNSDERLEFYVARYLSKSDALTLKRSRRVIGYCSQDQSPRYHAMTICQLAAETAKWDIFLRSHLDIMNDRFDRQSDGSYAWAGRKTYLKELEALDINAIDLLLGTVLRVENVSRNHYWGSIGRVGRALADASNKEELEKRMLAMMQDDGLDVYNRLLIAYLFSNYAYNLEDEDSKHANLRILETTVKQMPQPIQGVWQKRR